jgi:type IV pilus assembly protein PilM
VPRGAVGLDIGTRTVHLVQLAAGRGGSTITNFGGVSLPEGAVSEGEVVDPDAVGTAIKQLMAGTKIRSKDIHLGIANQRVVVRQIEIPWMEDDELRTSLPFQVQEFIPIPVEDAELDYYVLEDVQTDEARSLRLLLVAAHKEMVASHLAAISAAGLRAVSVDLNPFAILRTLGSDSSLQSGPEVLIDIGAGVTDIVVHEQSVPRFVRILVLGGGDITEALSSGLTIDREEAERLKHQTSAKGTGPDPTAARIVENQAREFINEIRSSLDYYRTQVHSAPISRVVLTGGGALLDGLVERLGDALGLPVSLGNPFDRYPVKNTAFGPDELAQVGPTLVTALGLALGGAE